MCCNFKNILKVSEKSNKFLLKDKSRVGIIVDYSRDCTVVNGV